MITRRRDGRWVASVTMQGKRKHIYGNTRQEVRAKLGTLGTQDPIGQSMTVGSFLSEWLRKMQHSWRDLIYVMTNNLARKNRLLHQENKRLRKLEK